MPVSSTDESRLGGISFLAGLARPALIEFEQRCRWRRHGASEQTLDRDDPGDDVYFIVEGAVRIVNYSLAGREVAFARLGAGTMFGELAALDGRPRSAAVAAVENSHLASVPARIFKSLLLDHPEMMMDLLQRLVEMIRRDTERIMDLSTLGAVQRVFVELIRLAETVGHREADGSSRISPLPKHQAIAGRASTTRETVARTLSQLVSGGIAERDDGAIVVRNLERLKQLAIALDVGD